ncbi:MAG: glycoside hydrolase family 3 N-terminal domain-containing protein, partial [Acidobacteriota bacterium]
MASFRELSRLFAGFFLIASLLASLQAERPPQHDLDFCIGQMLMVGFRGLELDSEAPFLQQVESLHLGGTILFDYDVPSRTPLRNIQSWGQVRTLTRALQAAAQTPLLIAIDQEGGRVNRLKPRFGFPESKSQAELARMDDEQQTRLQAKTTARLLFDLGINLNFAPVLDLAVHPGNPIIAQLERSYSDQPAMVEKHARWTIEEFHRAGVLVAVKHFPGHGSSHEDSHLGLPDVSDHWTPVELQPYAALVRQGLPDMVMTAHLFNRHWDPELPATLSQKVIGQMLRAQIGFEGVVVSDDMQMGAITSQFSL